MISCREEMVEGGKNRALDNVMFRSILLIGIVGNGSDIICLYITRKTGTHKSLWVPDVC